MPTSLTHIGLCATKASDPATTGISQEGVVGRKLGDLVLCGALAADVGACRAAISTYNITHGTTPTKVGTPGIVDYDCAVVEEAAPETPETPSEEGICSGGGMALTGTKATGLKSTSHGQIKVIDHMSGGLSLCGAVVEDVGACRAAIGTYNIPHGQSSPSTPVCGFPEHMGMYGRYIPPVEPEPGPGPAPEEEICAGGGMALTGIVASGPKSTRHGQAKIVDRMSGGIGLCGAVVEDVGACRAAMGTYNIPHGQSSPGEVACDVPEHMNVYKRYTPGEEPPIPVFSDTSDLRAYINALQPDTSDLSADITPQLGPRSDIYGSISAWVREATSDLLADIYGHISDEGNLYANIRGYISAHTSALEYEETIISTPGGFSVLRRLLTTFPDLTATLYGWDYYDIVASITGTLIFTTDLLANIIPIIPSSSDINADIIATYTYDIGATIGTIPYVPIGGSLTPIPPVDLNGELVGYRPADFPAFAGGHYPEDLPASLLVNRPVALLAWIRVGVLEAEEDITATITASGGYSDLSVELTALLQGAKDLSTSITCRIPVDIRGFIRGWGEIDLEASIQGVYSNDIGGWVTGWSRFNESDMAAFTRASWEGTSEVITDIYGWVSTHTSDKPYNGHLYKSLPERIVIGTRGGLSLVRLEVVWGTFPDLHATITGRPFYTSELRAYILPSQQIYRDLGATLNAVTEVVHVSKIPINLVNLSDLSVYISAFSGYLPMAANIRGVSETNTNTSAGSGWVYKSSSVRFYLGTNKGLVIPPRQEQTIRPEVFLNYSLTPDLWAYVYGWEADDLQASITVQPYAHLYGSVTAQDTSHLASLFATITSTYTVDFTASITGRGSYVGLSADIFALGGNSELTATIQPYLKILGYRLITVETQPFYDLRAIVNPIASCAAFSTYKNLSVFIRAASIPTGQGYLYASIYPRTDRSDMGATIVGRLYTRLKLVDISFRTLTRSSSPLSALVVGVGTGAINMSASITGMPWESDLGATITAIRYRLGKPEPPETIKVYKWEGQFATLYKELVLTFSSRVTDYIYDALDSAVYPIGDGRWALDVSEFTEVDSFYDRDPGDKSRPIDSIIEYDSVDEAIREAIRILTESYTSDMTASITATGGYLGMSADIFGLRQDRVSDLTASVTLVNNLPDLYASISAYSGYNPLTAHIVGEDSDEPDLTADIRGVVYTGIGADITGTI